MLLPPALGFSPHPPVSVYGTGMCHTIAAFLDGRNHPLPYFGSVRVTSSDRREDLPSLLLPRLRRSSHSRPGLSFRVPTVLVAHGAGISACCPSATPFGLALGPDFPRADQLHPGILGYSARRIPTSVSLLIPAFSLLTRPQPLTVLLPPCNNAPLPYPLMGASRASAACFSPGHFRRRTSRPVSYYALFECVAASEPTSWLSWKSHILFHLTRTSGP